MRKLLLSYLFLFLIVVGCASKQPIQQQSPVEVQPPVNQPVSKVVYFKTTSTLSWMKEVVKKANCVANNKDFLKEVESVPSFYWTNHTGVLVAKNLKSNKVALLGTYKSRNPWSKVNGYRDVNTGLIYFNLRRNPRAIKSMVNTAIHERSHHWYDHNGDRATGLNLKSVPHLVGNMSEKYVEFCND